MTGLKLQFVAPTFGYPTNNCDQTVILDHHLYQGKQVAALEAQSGDISSFQKLPQLLRRTALYAFPRTEVAPLTGTDWEKWLDDHCTNRQFSTEFSTLELSGVLAQLAYSSAATLTEEKRNAIMENGRRYAH